MRVSTVLLMVSTAAWCSAAPMQMPPQLPGLPGLNITDTVTIILSANKHRDTSSIQGMLTVRGQVSNPADPFDQPSKPTSSYVPTSPTKNTREI
jgi:hypothetical protein